MGPPANPGRFNPRLLLLFQKTKFELEIGQERTFQTRLGGPSERQLNLFTELKGAVWSKPIGENVELSAGSGFVVEKRFQPSGDTQTSVFIFAKAEVKKLKTFGPLDIAKLEAEAQVSGKLGREEPPDMTVSVGIGPEVELFDGKLTFGPSGYAEAKKDARGVTLSGKVKLSGTFHF